MIIEITDQQREVQSLAREFAAKEIAPHSADWNERHHVPVEVLLKMGELGLLGMVVPEEWGGTYSEYVSYALAIPLRGLSDGWLKALHQVNWFSHFATTFAFLAYFAYSKMIHPFTSLANVFFRRLKTMGELTPIENLEEAESFGIAKLEDFTWAQLMNLDACMHCGRCLEYCPPFNTDKPLRPRDLILEIGGYMADSGGIFSGELGEGENSARFRWGEGPERELIGGVVSAEELWDCTTCGACMEQCPVFIEHVPLIVGMRRNLVLEQGEFPDELTNVFNNLERLSSPYQFPPSQRDAWTKKMAQPVRIMGEAAGVLVEVFGISRQAQDGFALLSHSAPSRPRGGGCCPRRLCRWKT